MSLPQDKPDWTDADKWMVLKIIVGGLMLYFGWPIFVAIYRMFAIAFILLWALGGGFSH